MMNVLKDSTCFDVNYAIKQHKRFSWKIVLSDSAKHTYLENVGTYI